METRPFNSTERRLIAGISLVMGIRMLGISMIIPVFSIFATELPGSTGALAGLAVGIFGIIQILLQVPIGKLSDRWGRKQVTLAGLVIYFVGSVLSGLAQNVHHLIAARLLSGAGAIQGVTMAWLTDGISIHRRNTALSYVGISMGLAVIFGFTLSPSSRRSSTSRALLHLRGIIMVPFSIGFRQDNHTIFERSSGHQNRAAFRGDENPGPQPLNSSDLWETSTSTRFFSCCRAFQEGAGEWRPCGKFFIPVSSSARPSCSSSRAPRTGADARHYDRGDRLRVRGFLIAIFAVGITAIYVIFHLLRGALYSSPVGPAAASRFTNPQLMGTVLSIFNSSQVWVRIGGLLSGAHTRT